MGSARCGTDGCDIRWTAVVSTSLIYPTGYLTNGIQIQSGLKFFHSLYGGISTRSWPTTRLKCRRGWDPANVKEEHILEMQKVVEILVNSVLDMDIIAEAAPDHGVSVSGDEY